MRSDGRNFDAIRKIEVHLGYISHPAGSCLIKAGRTIVLCTASIEKRVPPFLIGKGSGWITAEYNLLPGSTIQRTARETTGRINARVQEIKRFIGRSLRAICDLNLLGELSIFIDCDVLQADGGTRTLSVTGGFLALAQAVKKLRQEGVIEKSPITDYLGAISVGIVNHKILVDLNYEEDAKAEVDMNVVLTGSGKIAEIQATAEKLPFSFETFSRMFEIARNAVAQIIELEKQLITI